MHWRVSALSIIVTVSCGHGLSSAAAGGTQSGRASVESTIPTAAEGIFLQRPIITGCLAECGPEDQSCVTECQVCVEKQRCQVLDEACKPCLEEVHATKAWVQHAGRETVDDGGIPLIHDGTRAQFMNAKLEALKSQRELRAARGGVLKAQREAEWAAEERASVEQSVHMAKKVLQDAEEKVAKWKQQNAERLKAMRAQSRKRRREQKQARRDLLKAKERLRQAKLRLQSSTSNDVEVASAEDEEGKLRNLVVKRQKAVVEAEKALTKQKRDADWLDRGLRKHVARAKQDVRAAREDLLTARAMERVSRERREDAKLRYLNAAEKAQISDKAASKMRRKLDESPLPTYIPQSTTSPLQRSAAHSCSRGRFFRIVAVVLTSFIALS